MTERIISPTTKPGSESNCVVNKKARALETARDRLLITGVVFALAFLVMGGRLIDLAVFDRPSHERVAGQPTVPEVGRGNIVDRNGVILATNLPAPSLYADPQALIDPKSAAEQLARILPGLGRQRLEEKLTSSNRFVWIRRHLTPEEQYAIHRLGIPGLDFVIEQRRVYPHGRAAAHVLGDTNIDGHGVAGVEHTFDQTLSTGQSVRLSIDLRVQDILRQELANARQEFSALGAAGLVLDVQTGEVLAMTSLPDFDPNAPGEDSGGARFNRVTKGVYEMGSIFKLFTVAMALDSGFTTLADSYDATKPLHVARFVIRDYHPEKRWLSVPEILMYSSNIGAAQIAQNVGGAVQKQYLGKLGLLQRASIELPELGTPELPPAWRDVYTMTVGFGHGISVTPLQLASAVAAVVNGGLLRPATIRRWEGIAPPPGRRVFSASTSRQMRELMRLVVLRGTGNKAEVAGYRVGGKTGTAEKQVGGRYQRDARISSFVGAFPMDAPRFVLLAMLDEPKGTKRTYKYATGGWVAAPVIGRLIQRMAPLLGIPPTADEEAAPEWRPSMPMQAATVERPLSRTLGEAIAGGRGRQLAFN